MDKNEYNLKLKEIERCVEQENYTEAVRLADEIDWKRVRNVRTLCMISEIYEAENRLEDSKMLLLRAYRRSPMARTILYRLVEITIKLKQFDEAIEYYSEYVQAAPHDNNKLILKYKIYRGRGSSVDEQIEILKEYLDQEYNEKYAYELAKLYQQADRIQECLATCDDLVLWFHSGKYVIRALELKKKYAALTPKQKEIYERRFDQDEENMSQEDKLGKEKQMVSTTRSSLAEEIMEDAEKTIAKDVAMAAAQDQESLQRAPGTEDKLAETKVAGVPGVRGSEPGSTVRLDTMSQIQAAIRNAGKRAAQTAQDVRQNLTKTPQGNPQIMQPEQTVRASAVRSAQEEQFVELDDSAKGASRYTAGGGQRTGAAARGSRYAAEGGQKTGTTAEAGAYAAEGGQKTGTAAGTGGYAAGSVQKTIAAARVDQAGAAEAQSEKASGIFRPSPAKQAAEREEPVREVINLTNLPDVDDDTDTGYGETMPDFRKLGEDGRQLFESIHTADVDTAQAARRLSERVSEEIREDEKAIREATYSAGQESDAAASSSAGQPGESEKSVSVKERVPVRTAEERFKEMLGLEEDLPKGRREDTEEQKLAEEKMAQAAIRMKGMQPAADMYSAAGGQSDAAMRAEGIPEEVPEMKPENVLEELPELKEEESLEEIPELKEEESLEEIPELKEEESLEEIPELKEEESLEEIPELKEVVSQENISDRKEEALEEYPEKAASANGQDVPADVPAEGQQDFSYMDLGADEVRPQQDTSEKYVRRGRSVSWHSVIGQNTEASGNKISDEELYETAIPFEQEAQRELETGVRGISGRTAGELHGAGIQAAQTAHGAIHAAQEAAQTAPGTPHAAQEAVQTAHGAIHAAQEAAQTAHGAIHAAQEAAQVVPGTTHAAQEAAQTAHGTIQEAQEEAAGQPAGGAPGAEEAARSLSGSAQNAEETITSRTAEGDAEKEQEMIQSAQERKFNTQELHTEMVKSMQAIVSGLRRPVFVEEEDDTERVLGSSKIQPDEELNIPVLQMPDSAQNKSAAQLSIDDILLSMGARGSAVREAVAKAEPPKGKQYEGVLSAVDEALLNMGIAPESLKEEKAQTEPDIVSIASKPAPEPRVAEDEVSLARTRELPVREISRLHAAASLKEIMAEIQGTEQGQPSDGSAAPEDEHLRIAGKAGGQNGQESAEALRTGGQETAGARAGFASKPSGYAPLSANDASDALITATVQDAVRSDKEYTDVLKPHRKWDTLEQFGKSYRQALEAADARESRNSAQFADAGGPVLSDRQASQGSRSDVAGSMMDDGRAGDAAISPLDEALIGGRGASPSDGAAGGPGQDQAGETSGGMKELSEQPSASQIAESSHGPAENAELYKDLYLKPYLRELFNGFLGVGNLEGQIQNAINNALAKKGDNTSRSGNILILGGHGCGKTTIATGLARAIAQEQGSQFVKMARIYATDLNRKDLPSTLAKIAGGILIVEEAGDLDDMTAEKLTTAMEFRTEGLIIVMEDEQKYIQDMLKRHPRLTMKFTSQIFIPAFTPDELVGFASIYADDEGYSLSEGAKAALAGRISSLMNESEPISITRMHELVDGGIRKANVLSRKLFGGRKRFDEEGRIIIQDKDV